MSRWVQTPMRVKMMPIGNSVTAAMPAAMPPIMPAGPLGWGEQAMTSRPRPTTVSTTPMMVNTRIGALCHEPGGP